MQTLIALALVLATFRPSAAAPEVGTAIGNRVPAFTAQAVDLSAKTPKTTTFDSQKTKHATAYLFVGTTCPATLAYLERIRALQKTYAPKGVDFVFDYPNKTDTSDAKRTFHREKLLGRMIGNEENRRRQGCS